MNDNKKIAVTTFNWGPCIIKLKMEDEYKKLFLEEAKNNTEDYRSKLAGILEHETGYNSKSKEKLLPILSIYLGVYDQMYERYFLSDVKDELFTNNDHRLKNDNDGIDGSHSDSFPKPSTKIDLG